MTEPLPPYTGNTTECPKCSNIGALTVWEDAYVVESLTVRPERLRRICGRCAYTWHEALHPRP